MLVWNVYLAVMYFLSYTVFEKSNNFLLQWFFKFKKEKFPEIVNCVSTVSVSFCI